MAFKKSLWLNYDFGLRGNYDGLYNFLDSHQARDCGNGLAYFEYDNPDHLNPDELIERLKTELQTAVAPGPGDRIYVIWRQDEEESAIKIKGKFLFGNRKTAPWNGYSTLSDNKISDEAI